MTVPSFRLAAFLFVAASVPASAGVIVPAPLAGAAGPAGLIAAGAAYVGYRLYKRFAAR
jgi:hypothetical protein